MSLEDMPDTDHPLMPQASGASGFVRDRPVTQEGMLLDPNRHHVVRDEFLERSLGTAALAIAAIEAGGQLFMVINTKDVEHMEAPFHLVNVRKPDERVGLWPDAPIVVGTKHPDHFTYQNGVSREHFVVTLGMDKSVQPREIHLQDLGSTNGTKVSGFELSPEESEDRKQIWANYTNRLIDDLVGLEGYTPPDKTAPHGRIEGRPIIGNESRSLKGGTYGTTHSEQLVIDDEHPLVAGVVGQVIRDLQEMSSDYVMGQRDILEEINRQVGEVLEYKLKAVEELSAPYYDRQGTINLSDYIKNQIGVCRHQAILAGLIMEKAIEVGLLKGSIGVQRNMDFEANGAHAWAVFRDEASHVIIVDPAQHFVGTRDEAKKEYGRWNYYAAV